MYINLNDRLTVLGIISSLVGRLLTRNRGKTRKVLLKLHIPHWSLFLMCPSDVLWSPVLGVTD